MNEKECEKEEETHGKPKDQAMAVDEKIDREEKSRPCDTEHAKQKMAIGKEQDTMDGKRDQNDEEVENNAEILDGEAQHSAAAAAAHSTVIMQTANDDTDKIDGDTAAVTDMGMGRGRDADDGDNEMKRDSEAVAMVSHEVHTFLSYFYSLQQKNN